MIFIPYRKIAITTDMEAGEVKINLVEHIQQSKAKSWFLTMTDDYAISGKRKGEVFLLQKSHSKNSNKVKLYISPGSPAIVHITIHPSFWGLFPFCILLLIIMIFSLFHTAFLVLGAFLVLVVYISAVIRVVFDSWWFADLLKKKILIKA